MEDKLEETAKRISGKTGEGINKMPIFATLDFLRRTIKMLEENPTPRKNELIRKIKSNISFSEKDKELLKAERIRAELTAKKYTVLLTDKQKEILRELIKEEKERNPRYKFYSYFDLVEMRKELEDE